MESRGDHLNSVAESLIPLQNVTRLETKHTQWSYKIKFDPSVGIEDIWVDCQTLEYLNSLRENIFVSQSFSVAPVPLPKESQENTASARGTSQSKTTVQTAAAATRSQPKRQSKLKLSATSVDSGSTGVTQTQNSVSSKMRPSRAIKSSANNPAGLAGHE